MKRLIERLWFALASSLLALSIVSCATVFKGSTEEVYFNSEPEGALLLVDGSQRGKTPLVLELRSNKTHAVIFKMPGYKPESVTITKSIGGGYLALDVLFGFFPIIVDAATGNWYMLDQDHVHVVLTKEGTESK